MSPVLTISGKNLTQIQIATPEFERRGYHVSDYDVSLFKYDEHFWVLFSKGERPEGHRGSAPGSPSFEVEIEATTGKIVRANFAR